MGRPRQARKSSIPKTPYSSVDKNPRSTRHSTRVLHELDISSNTSQNVRHSLEYKQRNIFDWYEDRQYEADNAICSPDAGGIFSSEWQSRLAMWEKKFGQDNALYNNKVDLYENSPEDLELGLFFLAHPISAFSLWHLLQACYQLDRLICGDSSNNDHDISAWQQLRPFQYLLSSEIVSTWDKHLAVFSSEVKRSSNRFEKEAVEHRLQAIFKDVQFLGEALSTVVVAFKGQHSSLEPCPDWMLDVVQDGVDSRCRAIGEHIKHLS